MLRKSIGGRRSQGLLRVSVRVRVRVRVRFRVRVQLAGRESGKRSGAAEEARDFFLPLCFLVREERGFRAPRKGAPETGASRGSQRGPQRRA